MAARTPGYNCSLVTCIDIFLRRGGSKWCSQRPAMPRVTQNADERRRHDGSDYQCVCGIPEYHCCAAGVSISCYVSCRRLTYQRTTPRRQNARLGFTPSRPVAGAGNGMLSRACAGSVLVMVTHRSRSLLVIRHSRSGCCIR